MTTTCTRRRFLQSLGLSATTLTLTQIAPAIEPIQRAGKPCLRLSLAAYSFRQFFGKPRAGAATDRPFDMMQFIDYCADQGCDGAEPTSYYFPKDLTADYLVALRRHAFLRGVAISGTAVGNNFTLPPGPKRDADIAAVKQWIDHAAVLGAPHIRIFAGAPGRDVSRDEARKLCLAAMEECGAYAGRKGIFLGLENHGGIVSEPEEMLELIRAVKNPWVGVNLDTGNFHNEDPYAGLALCAPYAVNVQVKVEISPRGKGTQPTDLNRIVKILREANYQGFVALEYEAKEDPWQAVPEWLKQMKAAFSA